MVFKVVLGIAQQLIIDRAGVSLAILPFGWGTIFFPKDNRPLQYRHQWFVADPIERVSTPFGFNGCIKGPEGLKDSKGSSEKRPESLCDDPTSPTSEIMSALKESQSGELDAFV
ncbi:MAG: hypothetical protein V2J25_15865 [Desulfatiglans sp.]|jgi:hypothetical protein|nr:hypothetical protein [Thermodesulfobacteriota bacterium]MEE4354338.1 hypothetical protein [Desulfatiglans sp.]